MGPGPDQRREELKRKLAAASTASSSKKKRRLQSSLRPAHSEGDEEEGDKEEMFSMICNFNRCNNLKRMHPSGNTLFAFCSDHNPSSEPSIAPTRKIKKKSQKIQENNLLATETPKALAIASTARAAKTQSKTRDAYHAAELERLTGESLGMSSRGAKPQRKPNKPAGANVKIQSTKSGGRKLPWKDGKKEVPARASRASTRKIISTAKRAAAELQASDDMRAEQEWGGRITRKMRMRIMRRRTRTVQRTRGSLCCIFVSAYDYLSSFIIQLRFQAFIHAPFTTHLPHSLQYDSKVPLGPDHVWLQIAPEKPPADWVFPRFR